MSETHRDPSGRPRRFPLPLVWLLSFLLFSAIAVWRAPLDWPSAFALDVELPPSPGTGAGELLFHSGRGAQSDLLLISREQGGTARLEYRNLGGVIVRSESFVEPADRMLHLGLSWPAFMHRGPGKQPLVVVVNGHQVLGMRVASHACDAKRLVLVDAQDLEMQPLPEQFSGRVFHGGRLASGLVSPADSGFLERSVFVLGEQPGRIVACALLAFLPVLLWMAKGRWTSLLPASSARSGFGAMLCCLLICAGVQSWFLGQGGGLGEPEHFGYFYDYQARSLLQGRLDVPPEGISGEAFVHEGLSYGYFGPTPALLRIPLELADVGNFARSRLSVLLALGLSLVGAYAALRQASRLILGKDREPGVGVVVLLCLNVGLGLPLLLLATRSYVYHEAIAWGTSFAVMSAACTLGWLLRPGARAWLAALVLGVFSIQARAPVGLYALWFLACSSLWLLWSERRKGVPARTWRARILVICLAAAGVASFNLVGYAKFRSLNGCPLQLHRPYTPERLARIGNQVFHAENIPYLAWNYGIAAMPSFGGGFPWVGLVRPAPPSPASPARMDLMEPSVSFPWSMPVLLLWAFSGLLAGGLSGSRRRGLWVLCACAFAVPALSMCTVIAISQRYTADFLPGILLAGLFGVVLLEDHGSRWSRRVLVCSGILTVAALLFSAGICLRTQGELTYGVNPARLEEYGRLKAWVDGLLAGPAEPGRRD